MASNDLDVSERTDDAAVLSLRLRARRTGRAADYANPEGIGFKRILDVAIVLATAPIVAPIIVLAALCVAIEDRGPVFFRQSRIGYKGRAFEMIKIRSMRPEPAGSLETRDNDDRITAVGRVIRRTRIDELPQLWNVLRGEMSVIGPRPEAEALCASYRDGLPGYDERHEVLPGLTGLAQVHQGHVTGLSAVAEKLRWDKIYVRNATVWMDLAILLKTVRVVIGGFGAR